MAENESITLEAIIQLHDEFTEQLNALAQKAQEFKTQTEQIEPKITVVDKATAKFKKILEKTQMLKRIKNKIPVGVKDRASSAIKKIQKNLLYLKAKKIALKIKDKATKVIGKIGKKIKDLVKKKWEAHVSVKDGASAVLSKIKTLLAAVATGAVIKTVIQGGSELQQQEVAMEHFMGVGNTGKSKKELHQMTQSYIGDLKGNANATPYGTGEVIKAGTRALTVASGNQGQAMQLVKMAENMAASDPNKSLDDAIEALADMKMGEFERMKEFGFKGTKEGFDKAGGDYFKMKDQDGRTLDQTFGGLANKQANTAQGKFSTITGNIGTASQNLGKGLLEGLDPVLTKLRDGFANLLGGKKGDQFTKWGKQAGQTISQVTKSLTRFKKPFAEVKTLIKNIAISTGNMFKAFLKGMKIQGVFKAFAPTLRTFSKIALMAAKNAPVFKLMWTAAGLAVGLALRAIGVAVSVLMKAIQIALQIINGLLKVAIGVVNLFKTAWHTACTLIRSAINGVKSAVSSMAFAIKTAVNGAKTAINNMGEAWTRLKHRIESNPIVQTIKKVFTGGGDDGGTEHRAIGEKRVPYDGFNATLHAGERVLTRLEADRMDRGGSGGDIKIVVNATVREEADIQKIINGVVEEIKKHRKK